MQDTPESIGRTMFILLMRPEITMATAYLDITSQPCSKILPLHKETNLLGSPLDNRTQLDISIVVIRLIFKAN